MIGFANPDDAVHLVDDTLLFMLWMYDLPTWLLGLIIVTFFVVVSLLGLFFFHRRLHKSQSANVIDNGTVGWFFSGLTLLYGLLLGLLTVATWGSFTDASGIASQESATLSVLYRDLTGYSEPQQTELKDKLRAYTRFIIEKSWPAQRRGLIDGGESVKLEGLQNQLFETEPQTVGQQIVHTEAIRAFNSLVELRRQRIEALRGSVPNVLWSVVLIGAVATIIFSYCFSVVEFRLHALLTGILAGMIGLLVFLIIILDHPFWGEVSVSADAYERVFNHVMK